MPPVTPPQEELGFFDKTFKNTNIVILIIFGLCCGIIPLVLGIIGIATCKDPTAKRNAIIVTVVGAISFILSILLQLGGALAGW